MPKKSGECCSSEGITTSCSVEAVITINDRCQILLPKELRDKAGIKAGNKFAVISCIRDQDVCCIIFILASRLAESVKQFLGPPLKELIGGH